jgi:hypothetical protein
MSFSLLCSPIAVDQLVTWVHGETTLFHLYNSVDPMQ